MSHPPFKCFARALSKHNTVAIMSITVLFIACNCHPSDCSQSFNAVKLLNTYYLIPPLNFCILPPHIIRIVVPCEGSVNNKDD